jgi:hypothetical protein
MERQPWICPRCSKAISPDDTFVPDSGRLSHLDCKRPRVLSPEEHGVLFRFCSQHTVAVCAGLASGVYCLKRIRGFPLCKSDRGYARDIESPVVPFASAPGHSGGGLLSVSCSPKRGRGFPGVPLPVAGPFGGGSRVTARPIKADSICRRLT